MSAWLPRDGPAVLEGLRIRVSKARSDSHFVFETISWADHHAYMLRASAVSKVIHLFSVFGLYI